jgi:ribosomal 50S subunit-associated protein YjgA (DUF615 family)
MLPRGEHIMKDLLVAAKAHEAEILSRFPGIDQQQLKQLLRAMIAASDDSPCPTAAA